MPKKFPFQQEAGMKIEVPETRYAWDLIVTAPGTEHYSPGNAVFCTIRFSINVGNSMHRTQVLNVRLGCFNRFSGHDLTLLSNDKQA